MAAIAGKAREKGSNLQYLANIGETFYCCSSVVFIHVHVNVHVLEEFTNYMYSIGLVTVVIFSGAEDKDLDDLLADLCKFEEDTLAQLIATTNTDLDGESTTVTRYTHYLYKYMEFSFI